MSLADSPDYLFRPEDKALRMLFPSVEDSTHDSFDDFFDRELYGSSNDDDKGAPELDHLFADDPSVTLDPSKTYRLKREGSPQPWRKGVWCLNQKSNPELAVRKTRKIDRLAQQFVSPLNLMGDRYQAVRSPVRKPSANTKDSPARTKPARSVHNQPTHVPITRGQTVSSSQHFANLPVRIKMEQDDGLPHEFKNFHLQMPDNGLYLQPKDLRSHKHEPALRQATAHVVTRNATISHPPQSPTRYHYPFNHVPRLEDQVVPATSLIPSFSEPPDPQLIYDEVDQYVDAEQQDHPIWTTESLHSSDSSHYSHLSQYSNESYRQIYQNHLAQDWPSSSAVDVHGSMPLHEDAYHTMITASQRVNHQMAYQQQYQDGLGIHYPAVDEIGRAVTYSSPPASQLQHHAPSSPTQMTLASYPPLPPAPPMPPILNDSSPFLTPRQRGKCMSLSPSPPLSPTHMPSARSLRQRSPSRIDHGHNPSHARRKSLHKPGPINTTTTTIATTTKDSHRRTRSTSRPPRTPKTPRTPRTPTTSTFGQQVDFVNFTPKDSAKLMSDVAPSGSSKTRARREQEARDKRKRLSEAAMQAVMRVGGDLRDLEGAIFT